MSDQAVDSIGKTTALSRLRQLFDGVTIETVLIVAGAALSFLALCIDYYGFDASRSLGWKQQVGLGVGVAAMLAGSALEVRAGRRSLQDVLRFWAVAAQVAILVALLNLYRIESRIFIEVFAPLILFAFIANHHLPAHLRQPFFVLIGLGSIVAMIGAAAPTAALWLVGGSLAVIGICHIPAPLWARVTLLLAAGLGLGAMRAGVVETSWSPVVLPILASMFMFRVIIYVYDLHNGKGPKTIWGRLGYFFMPPNPVFPFFPVVDFATFGRTYYNEDANRIYQRGAIWILRGLVHLLIYRIMYLYLTLAPGSVSSPLELVQYITANFGLYFRVSGLFHLIVGMLLLFGFNLPETHTRFYFSNSFIDFWRRINIYWKDFMQKVFFNPSFTRLKRLGASHHASLLGAIAVVFATTWMFHSYQWFWLRGTLFLTLPDLLFWSMLGAFLAVQTTIENNRGSVDASRSTLLGTQTFLVVRTVCTMFIICLMWSLWSSETVLGWTDMLAASGVTPAFADPAAASPVDWAITLVAVAIVAFCASIAMGVTFGLGPHDAGAPKRARRKAAKAFDWDHALIGAAVMAGLLVIHAPGLQPRLSVDARRFVQDISTIKLNAQDEAQRTRGYYEGLTNVHRFSPELWELMAARPNNVSNTAEMPGIRQIDSYLAREFVPLSTSPFNGVTYAINEWGMRDGPGITVEKPEGVIRIALLGASRVSGWGVEHPDTFGERLEIALNEHSTAHGGPRYEVLNFSVDGYQQVQRLYALDLKVWPYEPDFVIFTGARSDLDIHHIAAMRYEQRPAPYEFIDETIAAAGVDDTMTQDRVQARIQPFAPELLADVYRQAVISSEEHGATPLWMYIPALQGVEEEPRAVYGSIAELADDAGFISLRTETMYEGRTVAEIEQGPWDGAHPNALGHQIIADLLFERFIDLETAGEIEMGLVD